MASMQVLIIQHVPWEKPGRILDNLEDLDIPTLTMNVTQRKKPDFPDFETLAGLVVMGGTMGANDFADYPGLKAEQKLILAAVDAGKPVLGVCLGHQLIATALGARLSAAKEPEIGFSPVKRVNRHDSFAGWNKQMMVLQWHQDSVSLPQDATLLAKSPFTDNQAFCYKTALGLQFHLEATATLLDEWLREPHMVQGLDKDTIQNIREDFDRYNPQIQPLAEHFFSAFAARCKTYGQSLTEESTAQEMLI